MNHTANTDRYTQMVYRRCGKSGILLPALSLGLWHNFGDESHFSNSKEMILGAFDLGITHFDIANNYGSPPGSVETTFGRIINKELRHHRDEILVSTKAGYYMWPGPYGEWGSKKNLIASLNQSLRRLNLDYVDIFYHHRPDDDTPLSETVDALEYAVRSGKALYVGISNYSVAQTARIVSLLDAKGIRCLIHQMKYSMLDRSNEDIFNCLNEKQIGSIAFSPLAQGLLTDKYLHDIPEDSRARSGSPFLSESQITDKILSKVVKLRQVAVTRGQSLSQLALAWVLRESHATSVIIGASKLSQIEENCKALNGLDICSTELEVIESILKE